MELDISRFKNVTSYVLPQNEPSPAQNKLRRAETSTKRARYEHLVKEQKRFELNLGVSTGRLPDILQPRAIGPTPSIPGGAPNILELQNRFNGLIWPTMTFAGEPLHSGMKVNPPDTEMYRGEFRHLGMMPSIYDTIFGNIGIHENYHWDNNKRPSPLFKSAKKLIEWDIAARLAVNEMRTSFAYHVNNDSDKHGIYMHIDFVFREGHTQEQDIEFVFPENDEQKAIWRNVFWGEPLPNNNQFPIIPANFALPATPPLTPTGSASSKASSAAKTEVSTGYGHPEPGGVLADEFGRLQMGTRTPAENASKSGKSSSATKSFNIEASKTKDPFFL